MIKLDQAVPANLGRRSRTAYQIGKTGCRKEGLGNPDPIPTWSETTHVPVLIDQSLSSNSMDSCAPGFEPCVWAGHVDTPTRPSLANPKELRDAVVEKLGR